jgi:hypothetical protein
VLGDGLAPRLFDACFDDELVNLRHIGTVTDMRRVWQRWTLWSQAIRRYLIP